MLSDLQPFPPQRQPSCITHTFLHLAPLLVPSLAPLCLGYTSLPHPENRSAAIKACAQDRDFTTGKRLFIEGRRAAGIATDKAADVAASAFAAAAAAAESGTSPVAPARVNAGVEAVYMASLAVGI